MAQGTRSRGQIIPRGDRRYLLRIFVGKDEQTGKRKYIAKTIDGTNAQARQELTKMVRESDTGTFIEPSKQTVKEYCTEWLKGKTNLGPKTLREYEARLTRDVFPTLGALRLEQLTGQRIQSLYASLTARALSPRTIEYTHTVFSQALESAVRFGFLVKNPAQYCELPKKVHHEQSVFSPSDASLFLEKSSEFSRWYTLWLVMLTTGLRPAEALALQWSDLDLETGILRVQRALVEIRPGVYEPGEPKTKKSKRAISLPKETVEGLKAHRKALGAIAGFVFPNAAGSHFDLSPIRKAWKKDIDKVNHDLAIVQDEKRRIPMVRLYDTRHTHITHLLMNNVHPQVAANRAGHSSIAVTMGTYSHVLPEVDKEAGDKIGALLFKRVAIVM